MKKVGALIDITYIKTSFINSLKESHLLRMGSINEIIANMRKVDEDKLFKGIQNHNYESFWEINSTLSDKHVADMKKYAVRIHSNKFDRALQPNCEITPFEFSGGD